MNNIVDKIYVINMKKDRDRLKRFREQIGNLFRYSIVEGIDPFNNEKYRTKYDEWFSKNSMDVTYWNFNWEYYTNRYPDLSLIKTKEKAWEHWINYGEKELRSCNPNNDIVNRGQWGCIYSHINIIKHAIKKNYNSILILEDDIILTYNFEEKIKELDNFCKIHNNWGIIYLGASQHNWDNIKINPNFYYANNTTSSFAYIIHNSFYKIILDQLLKMRKPVDNYLVDIQKKYYKQIYVIYPNIIICNLEESNIGKKRNNEEFYKKFKWIT
jgi:GR25 family glycosyltransferase involved in LPS biosynthesis